MLCSLRRRLHYCYGGKLGTRSAWLYLRVRVLLYSTNSRRHFSKLHSRTLAKVFRTTDLLEANWCTQKQQRWERKSVAQAAAQGKIHNHKKYAYYIYQEKSTPKVAKKCQNHPSIVEVETANFRKIVTLHFLLATPQFWFIYWGSILVGHTVVLKMVYFLGIEYSCCLICTLCSLTPKRLLWARTLDPDVLCYFYSSLKKRTKNRGWSTSCYVIRFRYPKRHNKNLCGPYLYLWSRNILFFDNFSKVANFPW